MESDGYRLVCTEGKLEDFYEVKGDLGRGQFAVVKKCLNKATKIEVAAKFIKVKRTRTSRNGLSRELIAREANILSSINHDKIIKLFHVFDNESEVVLVLELLSGGELFEKISEQEYLTEVDACFYTRQVLSAIDYLHDQQIVHLDIKPENIVLRSSQAPDVKLVDFGLAQKLVPGKEIKEMMGTPEFVAPEVINFETIGLYTDMWAIGVLAYILLSGCSPFLGDDNQETYQNIVRVDYHFEDEYFEKISDDAKDFVKRLLIKQPRKRSSAKQSLDHPWVKNMEFTPRARAQSSIIHTETFKAFVARRRWQASFQKLSAINRFSKFLRKTTSLPSLDEEFSSPRVSPGQSPSGSYIGLPDLPRPFKELYRGSCSSPAAISDSDMSLSVPLMLAPSQEALPVGSNENDSEGRSPSEAVTPHEAVSATADSAASNSSPDSQHKGTQNLENESRCAEVLNRKGSSELNTFMPIRDPSADNLMPRKTNEEDLLAGVSHWRGGIELAEEANASVLDDSGKATVDLSRDVASTEQDENKVNPSASQHELKVDGCLDRFRSLSEAEGKLLKASAAGCADGVESVQIDCVKVFDIRDTKACKIRESPSTRRKVMESNPQSVGEDERSEITKSDELTKNVDDVTARTEEAMPNGLHDDRPASQDVTNQDGEVSTNDDMNTSQEKDGEPNAPENTHRRLCPVKTIRLGELLERIIMEDTNQKPEQGALLNGPQPTFKETSV